MSKRSLTRLTDLFVQGKTIPLPDGSYLWIQVLNPYERDEAHSDATVARSRIVMALKADGAEHLKCAARLAEHGREAVVTELAAVKTSAKLGDLANEIRNDPDWTERLAIIERTDLSDAAKPLSEPELALLTQINADFYAELTSREGDERDYQTRSLTRLSDEDLVGEYADAWLDKRGAEMAQAEYALTEMWYATRWCEALPEPDGTFTHSACAGHPERVFASKGDARIAPGPLQDTLRSALSALNMEARDPKGSGSAASSSASSPTPSAPEASTPSTSTETPAPHPGT